MQLQNNQCLGVKIRILRNLSSRKKDTRKKFGKTLTIQREFGKTATMKQENFLGSGEKSQVTLT